MRNPVLVNLTIYTGRSFVFPITWRAGNDANSADRVNMTGWTAKMQLRSSATSSSVLLELSTTNGKITLGSDGSIVLNLLPADTATITAPSALYDLELIATDGSIIPFMYGKCKFIQRVTQ
jgi:hypothetical protein